VAGLSALSDRIIVVGGGICGLTAAVELAESADVRVVERLPAPGGTWQFDHPMIELLLGECRDRGVVTDWGQTALRWADGRLLLIGPGRREWVAADHLVFAGGARPATPAEARLFGARCAGVFTATVAHHLLEARIRLGRRIALCGNGFWSDLVLHEVPAGTEVILVGGSTTRPPSGITTRELPGHRPVQVLGRDRVQALVARSGPDELVVDCDAVVLAGDLRPLRNVDGAVVNRPDVTYVQPTAETLSADEAAEYARKAVAALIVKDTR
jgi:hypothetical protein